MKLSTEDKKEYISILRNNPLKMTTGQLCINLRPCPVCNTETYDFPHIDELVDYILNGVEEDGECEECRIAEFCKNATPLLDTDSSDYEDDMGMWIYPDERYPIGKMDPTSIFVMRSIISKFGDNSIANEVGMLKYGDFLKTPYWKVISYHVKLSANFSCEKCGSKNNLVSHHKTYKRHGYEHLYWNEDLICLCGKCHSIEHKKSRK